jgi:hypothetical protein
MTTQTTATATNTVALTEHTVTTLRELLATCEEFLRTAGPSVHAELAAYLANQAPPADPCWLIDMLGFHVIHLGHQTPATSPSVREVWQ